MTSWLPVGVALEAGEPVITCVDAEGADFAEPFLDETIAALRGRERRAFTCDAFASSAMPAGFIFHMSRCGSTLVSQMLKASVRVYSEPDAINDALLLPPPHARRALAAIIRAMSTQRAIFKFSSWNVLHFPLFAELFPDVPTLFVIRNPAEVLASIAKAPPGFVRNSHRFTGTVQTLLERFLECGGHAAAVVDYSQLPNVVWQTLPNLFGLDADVARMQDIARLDAKSPHRPFRAPEPPHPAFERYVTTSLRARYDELSRR